MIKFIFMLLGCSGIIAFAIGFGKVIIQDETNFKWLLLILYGIIASITGLIIAGALCERELPKSIHSTDFNVRSEIHIEYIDSVEVLRDTLYIFTPKK